MTCKGLKVEGKTHKVPKKDLTCKSSGIMCVVFQPAKATGTMYNPKVTGLGIEWGQDKSGKYTIVAKVTPNGQAEKAGVPHGARLLAVIEGLYAEHPAPEEDRGTDVSAMLPGTPSEDWSDWSGVPLSGVAKVIDDATPLRNQAKNPTGRPPLRLRFEIPPAVGTD